MRFIVTLLLALAVASPVFAGPQSTIGGARLENDMAHQVKAGWPSVGYECVASRRNGGGSTLRWR